MVADSADLSDLLRPTAVAIDVGVAGKKALLNFVATMVARDLALDPAMLAERLAERERLGSTGFGGGVALPHAKVAALSQVTGVFVRLAQPAEFAAIDHLPVDLVFALFSPVDAGAVHLKALARVSRRMRDAALLAKLRGAASTDAVYALLAGVEAQDAS